MPDAPSLPTIQGSADPTTKPDKVCRTCRERLPVSAFSIDRSKCDGLRPQCSACRREERASPESKQTERTYSQARLARPEVKALRAAYMKAYAATPRGAARKAEATVRFQSSAHAKARRSAYEKSPKGQALKYARRSKETARARQRSYDATPERRKYLLALTNRRRAINGVGGAYTPADIDAILIAQTGLCAYCEQPLGADYHVDHVLPIARGGSSHPSNICCACPRCNLSKGKKTAAEFIAHLHHREAA